MAGGISFVQILAGQTFTCGLSSSGSAYCWGTNGGKLGDGNPSSNPNSPTLVAGGLTFSALGLFGNNHACGLTTGGAAYCWGYNADGELGDGTPTDRYVPTAGTGGLSFSAIAGATYHSCALVAAGAAYCWGDNNVAQLGYGTPPTDSWMPGAVQGGYAFTAIAAGDNHTCGLGAGGAAVCWGYDGDGALGDGTTTTRVAPAPVSGGHSFVRLAAGASFTCGQTASATWCWGANASGQLGDGTTFGRLVPVQVGVLPPVAAVAVGPASSSLPTGATVQLTATVKDGDGNALTGRSITWASSDPTVATVDATGLVLGIAIGPATITATSEGVSGTATVTVTAAADLSSPGSVSAGYGHACDVRASLTLNCWGDNSSYQLGTGNSTSQSLPTTVSTALQFFQVAAGYNHTCGLASDSTAYCWGASGQGQGGNGSIYGSATPFPVQGGVHFAQIVSGFENSCARTADGAVYCWGTTIGMASDPGFPVRNVQASFSRSTLPA